MSNQTYECRICGEVNAAIRNHCRCCGTVRREASTVLRAVNGSIRQVESSLTSDGYIETIRNIGAELSFMRTHPTRVMMRSLKTVDLTYYAQE